MNNDFREKTLSSKTVYQGSFLEVRADISALCDGSKAHREKVIHPGAAMIIPVFEDQSMLMEKQYRYAVETHCIEFPAGRMESGESAIETAKRELVEETGYVAKNWEHLGFIHPGVGYTNEKIDIFVATLLEMTAPNRDEGEFLEVIRVSKKQVIEWIRSGKITDAKTIAGLFMIDL